MLFDAPLPRPPREVRSGVAHLPGFLTLEQQAEIVGLSRGIARAVAGTPAAMRRVPVGHGDGMTSAYLMTLGQAYLSVNWEATASEVAHFIQPHPTLSEAFGETMMSLTGRSLH